MTDDDRPTCEICGRRFLSVGRHVRVHGISPAEYRDQLGLRRSASLDAPSTRAKTVASIRATIDAGKLDAHYATNAARAGAAAASSRQALSHLRGLGRELPHGSPTTPRAVIAAIVAEIEAGTKVATAVKRSPVSYTTFHAGLARHPDLKERVRQARQRTTA